MATGAMMAKPATPWPYVGTFLACVAFAWSLASAWFNLVQRVHDLERAQQFEHGDVKAFLPKE